MTNPTSNFGWQMPTSTDLVTDLPADFEVFGQAVDTSMADLKGGTTGQILSKATNADMDFIWIANDQGDITGVTASSPLTGGGTSGAITIGIQDATTSVKGAVQLSDSTSTTSSVLASTPTATKAAYDLATTANTAAGTAQTTANAAIPKSTVTTAGDIIYSTGSSAVTRLGIGSTGNVLTVAGGVPTWAAPTSGGMTLLSTTSASTSSVVISSIPQTYQNLQIVITGLVSNGASYMKIGFNNNVTNWAGYSAVTQRGTTAGTVANQSSYIEVPKGATWDGSSGNTHTIDVYNYTSTSAQGKYISAGYASPNYTSDQGGFYCLLGAAITGFRIDCSAGSFIAGTIKIYGVK